MRIQAEANERIEAMKTKSVKAAPPGLRSPERSEARAVSRSSAVLCDQEVQTITSLPHTQHDILWTASCLEPILEDDGEAISDRDISQEGVDCARMIDNSVDDIDFLQSYDDPDDVTDDPILTDVMTISSVHARDASAPYQQCADVVHTEMMTMLAAVMISMTMMTALAPIINELSGKLQSTAINDVRNNNKT